MAAIDYLRDQGFSVRVTGERIVVSPASALTPDHRKYIKLHRIELLAEVAANDGETRRAAWDVLIPGYGQRRMIGQPCTRAEALEHVRGIWPGADIAAE